MTSRSPADIPIAIIGMAGIFPGARNLIEYWENILHQADCISEVPPSRWSIDDYYHADPKAIDKTYSKRGGFLPEIEFNPLEFGLPPNVLDVTDSSQVLSLIVAQRALDDAGYQHADQATRQRIGVVLGACVGQKLIHPLTQRLEAPVWEKVLKRNGLSEVDAQRIIGQIKQAYTEWDENAFPGLLGNVIAGRIANRLDLGGMNCTVDAACASSLAAIQMAVSDLQAHRSDMMISGGVDTDNSVFAYMCFSKTPALSRRDQIRPFDAESDGMLLGEGVGMVVLKRLDDARRDGDRIYAVLKGLGSSSDGKYKSIYAPRSSGQAIALERAYGNAGFPPTTIGLVEAHGTGTKAGDPAEIQGLKQVFGEEKLDSHDIALGSVKSQIGHTKAAAGAASLIKATLALHHKVLPPTINVTQPNPTLALEQSPFYLNTQARPWLRGGKTSPRRAGVSSFGFGGANYHAVLEEYQSEHEQGYRLQPVPASILLHAPTPEALRATCEQIQQQWQSDAAEAAYHALVQACATVQIPHSAARIGFVAESLDEARRLLARALKTLARLPHNEWEDPLGIYYRPSGLETKGKVVALFSGQGSQYVGMGQTLAVNFPEVRRAYDRMDRTLQREGLAAISTVVYPPPAFNDDQKANQAATLQQTDHAQPAIGALSMGLYTLLQRSGFRPDFVAGHSFGELTALWASGVLNDEDYGTLATERGRAMAVSLALQSDPGKMLAVQGDSQEIIEAIAPFPNITVANWNSPQQIILAGDSEDILKAQHYLAQADYQTTLLPVAAAFHTDRVRHAQQQFTQAIRQVTLQPPKCSVYSNMTAQPYPQDPVQIESMLADHMLNPVRFQAEIEAIYQAGGSIFVEVGPRQILTQLVKATLADKPHVAVALNPSRQKDSDRQFREAMVQLRVIGLELGNYDPYPLSKTVPQGQSKPGLIVHVSGCNYGDRRRRAQFLASLQDKSDSTSGDSNFTSTQSEIPQLTESQPARVPASQNGVSQSQTLSQKTVQSQTIPHVSSLSLEGESDMPSSPDSPIPQNLPSAANMLNPNGTDAKKPFVVDEPQSSQTPHSNAFPQTADTSALDQPNSFERALLTFLEHQAGVNRVQQQYLQNQAEYTRQFFQLMEDYYFGRPATANIGTALSDSHGDPSQTQSSQTLANTAETVPHKNGAVHSSMSANFTDTSVLEPSIRKAEGQSFSAAKVENTSVQHSSEYDTAYLGKSTAENHSLPTPPEAIPLPSEPSRATSLSNLTADQPLTPVIDVATLTSALLEIVSDKTGYPAEVLELGMDIEADLGIDSIKRVEILGAMQASFPELPSINPDDLMELRTLAEIAEYMGGWESAPKKHPV